MKKLTKSEINKKKIFKLETLKTQNTPIYIKQNVPDWLIPNKSGDRLLCELIKNKNKAKNASYAKKGFK